jgi:hypothetical protein
MARFRLNEPGFRGISRRGGRGLDLAVRWTMTNLVCGRAWSVLVLSALVMGACSDEGSQRDGADTSGTGAVTGADASGERNGEGTGGAPALTPAGVTAAEDCHYQAYEIITGGTDAVGCDYVTVTFSSPVPVETLQIDVTTSIGDTLEASNLDPWADTDEVPSEPELSMDYNEDRTQVLGFSIRKYISDHYSPEWVEIAMRERDQTIAEATIEPEYFCVAETFDDWCWKAAAETLSVTLP